MTTTTVTYIGRRRTANGRKVAYAYLDELGKTVLYPKALVPAPIGTNITLTHPDDGDTTRYYSAGPNAPALGAFTDHPHLMRWQVADRAAYEAKAQEDAIVRAARNADAMEAHILALVVAAEHLGTIDRAAFARYVENRLRGVR